MQFSYSLGGGGDGKRKLHPRVGGLGPSTQENFSVSLSKCRSIHQFLLAGKNFLYDTILNCNWENILRKLECLGEVSFPHGRLNLVITAD